MRLARTIVCTAGLVVALGGAQIAAAGADPAGPSPSHVQCETPVETHGDIAISSARAERGTTLTPSRPDETCTVTP